MVLKKRLVPFFAALMVSLVIIGLYCFTEMTVLHVVAGLK